MTIMILTYIRDTAIDAAGPVLTFYTEQQAVRTLKEAANSSESNIGKHPEDYIMYKCGMYNDQTGEVQAMEHVQLARAIDLVKGQQS